MYVLCEAICYAALVVERDAPPHELEFNLNILKSHPSSLLLYPLPSLDRGTLISSCFLAIGGQWCTLADFSGTFCTLQSLLEPEFGSMLLCPSVTMSPVQRLADACLKWNVCSCVHGNKGEEKWFVCYGRKIICQRSGSIAKNLPTKPEAVSVISVQPFQ